MKKLILSLAVFGLIGLSDAYGNSICGYLPHCHQHHGGIAHESRDNAARVVSIVALGIAVIAVIAIAASDNSRRSTGDARYDAYLRFH